MHSIKSITLPSFLRRTMKAYQLKSQIRELGCELHRIGRSRNWQIKAKFDQIEGVISFIEQSDEPSWQWVAKILRKQYENLTFDALMNIAKKKDSITVNELMTRTDCTISQARKVIDELEGF
ncbi:MAG: hypothetical protein HRT38_18110 [Alteromonadaceae bacterium]|nr:hypothetical protein [Alteromonadaceae bacterium]